MVLIGPQSQSTNPNISSAELMSPSPQQMSTSAWRESEKTATIDELIENQQRFVNSIDLCTISAFKRV
jgi:hypothetical protein